MTWWPEAGATRQTWPVRAGRWGTRRPGEDHRSSSAQEIGFAVVAMTITLAAVYAPVAFMTGRTGKLFAIEHSGIHGGHFFSHIIV